MWWWETLLIGVGIVTCFWLALFVLARHLPPGRTREYVAFAPNCLILLRRLRRDSRLPHRGRLVIGLAIGYLISPIQVIPNVIPVIGQLDDVTVLTLALRYACRCLPPEAVRAAWPGDPAHLDRLMGLEPEGAEA
jgi:uncharacterized membrane protein YkvA (DUF1232 family)